MLCLVTTRPYQCVGVETMRSFPFSQGGNSLPHLYLNLKWATQHFQSFILMLSQTRNIECALFGY